MGRRPIGKTAMTDAERQRRRRERLGIGGSYIPGWLPWDASQRLDRGKTSLLDDLGTWLEEGDAKAVAKWLAGHICDPDRWDEIDRLVRAEHERQAIEDAEYEARRLRDRESVTEQAADITEQEQYRDKDTVTKHARPAPSISNPPPALPKFTRAQLGAPPEGTENEQDPDSPPGVTRAMAWSMKHGHVHIRPLDERLHHERWKKAQAWVSALQKKATKKHKDYLPPADFRALVEQIRARDPKAADTLMRKYEEREHNAPRGRG